MAVPKYDAMFQPVIKSLSDGGAHTCGEIQDFVVQAMELTEEDLQEKIPSGGQTRFSNRINWVRSHLKHAGLIGSVGRGCYRLTEEGRRVLEEDISVLDARYLHRYPSYLAFLHPGETETAETGEQPGTPAVTDIGPDAFSDETPEERMEQAVAVLNRDLAEELLAAIMERSDAFFEHLVVELLLAMGYGGPESDVDSGFVTQRSRDGGIDGIIRQDKLGFDQIYIQAKRWAPDRTVGRPEIQKFCGALQDAGGSRGLFITTAQFSEPAKESAARQRIVLVDGDRLTRLMIEYGTGVTPVAKYEIKKIDTDFFSGDSI